MSVQCTSCNLFNSFSFQSQQNKCIKCSTTLYSEDIEFAKYHRELLKQRDFKKLNYNNNTWDNVEDSIIISTNIKG